MLDDYATVEGLSSPTPATKRTGDAKASPVLFDVGRILAFVFGTPQGDFNCLIKAIDELGIIYHNIICFIMY